MPCSSPTYADSHFGKERCKQKKRAMGKVGGKGAWSLQDFVVLFTSRCIRLLLFISDDVNQSNEIEIKQ